MVKKNTRLIDFEELRNECKRLEIKNSLEYRKRYREIPGAPSDPDRIYTMVWEGWGHFLQTNSVNKKETSFTFNGVTKNISELAKETGISRSTLSSRLKKNWPLDKALSTAPNEKCQTNKRH